MYVSDSPGQHDFGLLKKLVLPDGSVLRAQLPGRPTADCLFSDVLRDGKSLLKVGPLSLLLYTAWDDTCTFATVLWGGQDPHKCGACCNAKLLCQPPSVIIKAAVHLLPRFGLRLDNIALPAAPLQLPAFLSRGKRKHKPTWLAARTRSLRCRLLTLAMCKQVWNANACNAVVGAFNLQGSAWDRRKRQYTTYTAKPPTLSAEIRVKDVPVFASPAIMVSVGIIQECFSLIRKERRGWLTRQAMGAAQSCGQSTKFTEGSLCLLQQAGRLKHAWLSECLWT